jgi:hypothetical protein
MNDYCVFCGAVTDGRLACPNCRHHVENLTPEQRRTFETFERDARARENLRVACHNLRVVFESMLESVAETARQFAEKWRNTDGQQPRE